LASTLDTTYTRYPTLLIRLFVTVKTIVKLFESLKELEFAIIKLKNDHKATPFNTWYKEENISKMSISATNQ